MRPPDVRLASGLVIVPTVLVLADVVSNRTAFKFLLLPPLGALTYLVFVNPGHIAINLRRVVMCPTLVALWAWGVTNTIGYEAPAVALATVGTMLIMWLLDAYMVVPPLALELLTLLLHREVHGQLAYPASVLAFTTLIYALYLIWRRLPEAARGQKDAFPA